MLVICAPLIVLAAVTVVAVDGRPAFFVQERDGRRGRPFRMMKLRTMYRDSDDRLAALLDRDAVAAAEWATYLRLRHDPRVLPGVGRALRRWSLDELPQFVNVARGEMSLVGPRPIPVHLLDHLPASTVAARRTVKPGLTGLWQVSGRSDNDLDAMVRLDDEYLARRSLAADLRILARTPAAVLTRTGAF